jgi:protein gp37
MSDKTQQAPQHTFQLLTKRHGRMRSLLNNDRFPALIADRVVGFGAEFAEFDRWPLTNVWLGVSVEDQRWADIRIPALLDTPAAVRFLSCEPLLGPVTLAPEWLQADHETCTCSETAGCREIHWVIVGGESGRGARPMHPDWALDLRDQCAGANVPFHFKQWGAHGSDGVRRDKHINGGDLDGRTWDEFPEAVAS